MKKQLIILIYFVSLFIAACAGGNGSSENETRVGLTLKMPEAQKTVLSSQEKPAGEEVGSVRVRVETRPGPTTLKNELVNVIAGETLRVTLDLLPGLARTFIVDAFSGTNGGGEILFSGEETLNIIAGEAVEVVINMINQQNQSFSISPGSVVLQKSETQQFSILGTALGIVDWQVAAQNGGSGPLGTIDSAGNYAASALLPIDTSKTPLGIPIDIKVTAEADNGRDIASVKVVTGKDLVFSEFQVTPPGTGSFATSNVSAGQRSIVFVDGKVTVVWTRLHPDNQASEPTAVFSESPDGMTWSAPEPIIEIPDYIQGEASIAKGRDGTLYAAFLECYPGGCKDDSDVVRLARKSPDESAFVEMTTVDNSIGRRPRSPSIAVSPSGTVFLAWSERRGVPLPGDGFSYDIVLQRFAADGTALDQGKAKVIANQPGEESEPALAIAETGEVYLAWVFSLSGVPSEFAPRDIMVAVLRPGNTDFDPPIRVNDDDQNFNGDPDNYRDDQPTIAAGPSGTVYVAWRNDTCGASCDLISFDKGTLEASGLSFGTDEQMKPFFSVGNPRQNRPSLAWDGANGIYLSFGDNRSLLIGSPQYSAGIFFSKSIEDGKMFSDLVKIDGANDSNPRADPSIAVDAAGRVFASWVDYRGGISPNYIWFAKGSNPSQNDNGSEDR